MADDLSVEEKARILYRHCRAAGLSERSRSAVRAKAREIVAHKDFTPERIRTLAREVLPELESEGGTVTGDVIGKRALEAMQHPSERMRKAFRKLTSDHKAVLVALLDCDDRGAGMMEYLDTIARHRPDLSTADANQLLRDLVGTFLKARPSGQAASVRLRWFSLSWIHPSYRDLLIDELSGDAKMVSEFLSHASVRGLGLALSEAGGHEGERRTPLVRTPAAWSTLANRSKEIAEEDEQDTLRALLEVLAASMKSGSQTGSAEGALADMTRVVCTTAVGRWARDEPPDTRSLRAFFDAAIHLDPRPPFPEIARCWGTAVARVNETTTPGFVGDSSAVASLVGIIGIVERNYPAFAADPSYARERSKAKEKLFAAFAEEVEIGTDFDDAASNAAENARRLEAVAEALREIDTQDAHEDLLAAAYGVAQQFRELVPDEGEDPFYSNDDGVRLEPFSVDRLFEDL